MPVDLAFGFMFYNNVEEDNYYNSSSQWNSTYTYETSKMNFDIAGRLNFSDDLYVVAMANWLQGWDITRTSQWWDDYQNVYYNSELNFKALVGKTIKAGDTLKVRLATGLSLMGRTMPLYYYEDFVYNYKGYYNDDYDQYSFVSVPLNIAVTGKLNETWSFNAGAGMDILNLDGYKNGYQAADGSKTTKFTLDSVSDSQTIEPFMTYAFGLTGVIGDLRLDMYINPEIFITGPNFISNASVDLNQGVALVYNWK